MHLNFKYLKLKRLVLNAMIWSIDMGTDKVDPGATQYWGLQRSPERTTSAVAYFCKTQSYLCSTSSEGVSNTQRSDGEM